MQVRISLLRMMIYLPMVIADPIRNFLLLAMSINSSL